MEPYPLENIIFSPTLFNATAVIEFSPLLSMQRYVTVLQVIKDFHKRHSISSVTEFGCGSFVFLDRYLTKCDFLALVNQIDVDINRLNGALHMIQTNQYMKRSDNPQRKPLKINIFEGNVGEKDSRVTNGDVVVAIEVIEHLFENDLTMFPSTIFNFLKPKLVIVTTPNYDFNSLFKNGGKLRDEDHKFEFTKTQFINWGTEIVTKYPNYRVQYYGIGSAPVGVPSDIGYCTQMAIFEKIDMSDVSPDLCIQNYNFMGSYDYFTIVDDRTEDQKLFDHINQVIIKNTIDDENLVYIVSDKCVLKHGIECLPLKLLISNCSEFSLDEEKLINFMSKYEHRFTVRYFKEYGNVLVTSDDCEVYRCDEYIN